jgi:quercetin 2,3-dioxygenase
MPNTIIRAKERYEAKVWNWLRSFHLFSFSEYYDPKNIAFWNMRVFNDDFIRHQSGFWLHPHNNMEILTILFEWSITHGDSMGNRKTIYADEVQTMSAGSGVYHSEENLSNDDTHLYQLWFFPRHQNTTPWYKDTKIERQQNTLQLLVSWTEREAPAYLDTDIKVYEGNYTTTSKIEYEVKKWKGLFLYIHSGEIKWNNETLYSWDQLRVVEEWTYTFETPEIPTRFILIEVTL